MEVSLSRLPKLLVVVAAAILPGLWVELDGTDLPCDSKIADLDALIPPYVDSYGAPTASIEISFRNFGIVEFGKRYRLNNFPVDEVPTVLLQGAALQRDQYYTLITVDPDAVDPRVRNVSGVLHYFVANIPGSISSSQDVETVGEVVTGWLEPAPPIGTHRYMFLLFRQGYGKINTPEDIPRPLFSVRNFSTEFNLGFPIAGFLFRVTAPGPG